MNYSLIGTHVEFSQIALKNSNDKLVGGEQQAHILFYCRTATIAVSRDSNLEVRILPRVYLICIIS